MEEQLAARQVRAGIALLRCAGDDRRKIGEHLLIGNLSVLSKGISRHTHVRLYSTVW